MSYNPIVSKVANLNTRLTSAVLPLLNSACSFVQISPTEAVLLHTSSDTILAELYFVPSYKVVLTLNNPTDLSYNNLITLNTHILYLIEHTVGKLNAEAPNSNTNFLPRLRSNISNIKNKGIEYLILHR